MVPEGKGNPFLVNRLEPRSAMPLTRLPFEGSDFGETWLQGLLDENPELLPVSKIDDRVQGKLGSLGREIGTPAGPIDNLFLSSDGYIVLVETKLWRNPEARRMVIAQILDYAAHVRRWTYEKVEELWRRRHGDAGLWPDFAQDEPEQDWIDKVSRNLSEGRMTLLVVGDGTPERWQGLERPLMIFVHPLSGVVRPSSFDLETGRLCVMASRHTAGAVILARNHVTETLEACIPSATPPVGRPDVGGRGLFDNLSFWSRLRERGQVMTSVGSAY